MNVSLQWRQVQAVAAKEFRDRLRNRWVLAVAVVFTVFSLLITYFGSAAQGQIGPRSIELTIASLVSLVIYLIPLIALLLGFDAIVGERERGSLDLLLSMPITRFELLLGKYLGLAGALAFSTVAGFGLVGLVLSAQLDLNALFHYFGFMFSSVLLGCAFLSLAVMLSVFAADRTRASGLAIAMWFFFVLIFDLLVLGVVGGVLMLLLFVVQLSALRPDKKATERMRSRASAYALYVLAKAGRGDLARLRWWHDVQMKNDDSPLARAQVGAGLALMGDRSRARSASAADADRTNHPPATQGRMFPQALRRRFRIACGGQ